MVDKRRHNDLILDKNLIMRMPNVAMASTNCLIDFIQALTIKTALLSLRALLSSPEPNDPQDAEVAKMYISDRKKFEKTAKFWTETYAKEVNYDTMVKGLEDMGFDKASAKKALEKHDWDESRAVNELLGMQDENIRVNR